MAAEAKIRQLHLMDEATQTALSALVAGFAAENAEQELVLRKQELEDDAALREAVRAMQYDHLDLTKELNEYGVRLSQAEEQGRIIEGGAGVLAGMADAAFSGLNAIGAAEIVESA